MVQKSPSLAKNPKPTQSTKSAKSSNSREKIIIKSGLISIAVNFLLAFFKLVVGLIAGSIAIISDAAHGLVDAISGFVVAISGRIAEKEGHDSYKIHRIERVATFLIVGIILIVGISTLVESIEKIITPEEIDYSVPVVIILIASLLGKLFLTVYLRRQGKRTHSDALLASSIESLNDVLLSSTVIISALVYLIWHINIEAYVGIIISVVICNFGLSLLFHRGHTHACGHLEHDQPKPKPQKSKNNH